MDPINSLLELPPAELPTATLIAHRKYAAENIQLYQLGIGKGVVAMGGITLQSLVDKHQTIINAIDAELNRRTELETPDP